jgi:hypothetical protein
MSGDLSEVPSHLTGGCTRARERFELPAIAL